jgi:sensor histidine kinase regulating citrate/malate metabolism
MVNLAVQEASGSAVRASRSRRNTLWLRIGGLLVLVIASVLVLVSFLNYSNYRKNYLELNLTRYLVLAKDTRQSIVAGLNIGLRPSEDEHLQASLSEMARRFEGIRYIGVIDESGRLLGQGQLPRQSAERWKKRIETTDADTYWQANTADTYQIGLPFVNNFGIKIGAVVIGYERTPIEANIGDMLRKMSVDVAQTLVLMAVLTMAGVYALTRRLASDLSEVGATIDSALGAATPPLIDGHLLGEDVARDINEFTTISHRLAGQLSRLESEIGQAAPLAPAGPREGA